MENRELKLFSIHNSQILTETKKKTRDLGPNHVKLNTELGEKIDKLNILTIFFTIDFTRANQKINKIDFQSQFF